MLAVPDVAADYDTFMTRRRIMLTTKQKSKLLNRLRFQRVELWGRGFELPTYGLGI